MAESDQEALDWVMDPKGSNYYYFHYHYSFAEYSKHESFNMASGYDRALSGTEERITITVSIKQLM